MLEVSTPSAVHESDKELIGDPIKTILKEMNLVSFQRRFWQFLDWVDDFDRKIHQIKIDKVLGLWAVGSITLKNAQIAEAVEPDQW